MDGRSTDHTAAVVSEYASRLTWISEKDRGQAHAINKGFTGAKGEIVAWLNSDDILLPGAINEGGGRILQRAEAGGRDLWRRLRDGPGRPHRTPVSGHRAVQFVEAGLSCPITFCSNPPSSGALRWRTSAGWMRVSTTRWIGTCLSAWENGSVCIMSRNIWAFSASIRRLRASRGDGHAQKRFGTCWSVTQDKSEHQVIGSTGCMRASQRVEGVGKSGARSAAGRGELPVLASLSCNDESSDAN
jgi:hypothetical protein